MSNTPYKEEFMECRPGCGACCVVISISTSIPGMPDGKPAGVRCIHLTSNGLCALFGLPERPPVCSGFKAERAICGYTAQDAIKNISKLEGLKQIEF